MAITFPLSAPASPQPNALKMRAKNIVGAVSSPFTQQTQIVEFPGEWWELQVAFPPMKRANAEAWVTFLISLRGLSGTFLYGDPSYPGPAGVATGTPLVNATNAAGNKTLVTKGWTPSITGILKAGDLLQIGSGTTQRLYKVLKDVNSDGSGNATLDIFPRLREQLSDGASITLTSPKGCFRLSSNQREWDTDVARFVGLSFDAVEAF